MPLHDTGSASLTASHGAIRLGRSLALPESCKAVWFDELGPDHPFMSMGFDPAPWNVILSI